MPLLLRLRRRSSTSDNNGRIVPPHKDVDATGRGTQSPCPFYFISRNAVKKRFLVLAAAACALSIVAGGCSREKSPPRPQPAKKEISRTEKKSAPKPRVKLFTGTIEALDDKAGTLTLKGPKATMRFHVRGKGKKQLDDLDLGDKVIVKHVDMIALSIVRPRTGKSVLARMTPPPVIDPP